MLQFINEGVSQRKIADDFGIARSAVQRIDKVQRKEIFEAFENNCSDERRRKKTKTVYDEVNRLVLEFFTKCRATNIPLTGPMLQEKASQIAESLKIKDIYASNGWLDKFRTRNNIKFSILFGEAAAVNMEVVFLMII